MGRERRSLSDPEGPSMEKMELSDFKKLQKNEQPSHVGQPVPFLQLFRFASYGERVLLCVATFATFISSTCYPLLNNLMGERSGLVVALSMKPPPSCQINGSIHSPQNLNEAAKDALLAKQWTYSTYLAILGVIEFICSYLFISIFRRTSERMVHRVRKAYLRALLRQDVGWYDTVQDKNFVAKLTDDLDKLQEATGEKVGFFLYNTLCSIVCVICAFYYGWLLALVILASLPVMSAWSYLVSIMQSKLTVKEQLEYSKSGTVAQEALANIRTVMAFGGQELEMKRFHNGLVSALSIAKKKGLLTAVGNGIMWFLNYATLALTFWYGMKLIIDGRGPCGEKKDPGAYGPTEVSVIFFSIMYAAFRFGIAISYLRTFSTGCGAATKIYEVLDRTPPIDSYSDTGINPTVPVKGKIQFRKVRFSYPSRPDVPILRGLDLTIEPGTTVAFVGNSGCGKSTCLQLLQRFYDPQSGSIWVDDTDTKDYNLKWYRSHVGVVSQEPILFNTTIAENIRYGRDDVTDQEIEAACRVSNAHAFIMKLPKKYETLVGDRGFQLSGGQKQRIAIARALVRNPKILLLDEATSALDTHSERLVQKALDNASKGRTTLIVAHRLSTIRNADVIVAFQDGKVAEMGTHKDLLERKGIYYHLVTTQVGDDLTTTDQQGENELRRQSEQDENYAVQHAEQEKADEQLERPSLIRLFKFSSNEWHLLTIGLIMAILNGLVLPAYSYFYGQVMTVMMETDKTVARDRTEYYATVFLAIGFFAGISNFGFTSCFSIAGELLTDRLRKMSFKTMLKQDLAWYDDPKNSVGALCARLSGDTSSIQGATGSWMGTLTQAFTTIVFSVAISFYVLPKLAAVAVIFSPVIFIATYLSDRMLQGQQIEEKAALEQASKLVFQAVSNIRTVASLCKEDKFVDMYSSHLVEPHRKAIRYSHMFGTVHAISQSSFFFAYAVIAYYGVYLVRYEGIDYSGLYVIGEGLVWVFFLLGQNLAFAPNYNKGKVAGGRILKLLASKPKIESSPGTGLQMLTSDGKVEFNQVEFRYPTRPDSKILKGLSLAIQPNSNVAICGPSGSGKSTCIQLILRYYDPESGVVKLDDSDVASLNVGALRSHMAIVSQEPALFDRTLAENIAYGDNRKEVEMDEIIAAARAANIHDFIVSLPAGYSAKVGEMGSQLSGGQKQRVAIARALVRNPKLLLLDEATSALDAESEKVVQAALDNAATGRTCITIAHRLTSIQNADRIIVVNNGSVCESGKHEELLRKRGVYSKLWKLQHNPTN